MFPPAASCEGWILEWRARVPYRGGMLSQCVRCGKPASSRMMFSYPDRHLWLEDLTTIDVPGYPMCATHAGRLTPPLGWTFTDYRTVTPLFAPLEVA